MAVLGVILFAVMGLTTEIVVGWNEGERQEVSHKLNYELIVKLCSQIMLRIV